MEKKRMLQTVGLAMQRGSRRRGNYLRNKKIFAEVGENVRFQPRLIPLYPELIKLHNNIMVAAGVRFVTHDASYAILNGMDMGFFPEKVGCIEVMDNVYIGYNCTIMSNVKIGSNIIIGANSIVTKDLESNGVYVGSPARKIGSFDDFVEKMKFDPTTGGYNYPIVEHNQRITEMEAELAWADFNKTREDK